MVHIDNDENIITWRRSQGRRDNSNNLKTKKNIRKNYKF